MTTQSRMQQIDTLANYPMGTKPDSFRLIKKTFKSGEPMYKPQNKMFHFCKTFCSKITLVNTIQNVILNPI